MVAAQGGGKAWQMQQVLQIVRRGLVRAEGLIRHPRELLTLLTKAERRLDQLPAGPLTPIKRDVQTLLRLMRAYGEGRYRQVSGKNPAVAGLGGLHLGSSHHPGAGCPARRVRARRSA